MERCNILWFRRDLRLEDNPALVAAAKSPGRLLPVFIWCPEEDGNYRPGQASRWWLKESLLHLSSSLRSLGLRLSFIRGTSSLSVFRQIASETRCSTHVFCNHLYDPISVARDRRLKQGLLEDGIPVHTFNSDSLYEPCEIYDHQGQALTTFAAFWSRFTTMPFLPEAPLLLPKTFLPYQGSLQLSCSLDELGLENLSERSSNAVLARSWSPGWNKADKKFELFVSGPLKDYAANGNTSRLSPHFHYGEISIRKVFHCIRSLTKDRQSPACAGAHAFLRAIGLREYSRYLSFHFPFNHEKSMLVSLRNFPWRTDEGMLTAWKQGRTGYPIVDAGMRELWATGWLHCRIRVVVSSFFVKFLQLHWTWGVRHFWNTLLDADLENDVLGWQYISGSLSDGLELTRLDSPQDQGRELDPQGDYVRKWLPELSRLPAEWIHQPWNAPQKVLLSAGIELGSNYPRPVVSVAVARGRLQQALEQMSRTAPQMQEGQGETMDIIVSHTRGSLRSVICSGNDDQLVPTFRAQLNG